jgi:hypothetical protein
MSLLTEPGKDWTQAQVEAAVADYFSMLAEDLAGRPYNKAQHNRQLQQLIGRSAGSIERKHQNISAVLRELDLPWINGYKPLPNYQHLLFEIIEEQLQADRSKIVATTRTIIDEPVAAILPNGNLSDIEVRAPVLEPREYEARQLRQREPVGRKRDYLSIDARNRALGFAGEEFMTEFERRRLFNAGRADLSKNVDHVAASQGDGLGYDISSFELDGSPRFIEVKTTSFAALTPFFVSRFEVHASERLAPNYRVCRLFNFRKQPQFFSLPGSIQQSCRLEAEQFTARVG